jgi:CheY-like chemotaxis protein
MRALWITVCLTVNALAQDSQTALRTLTTAHEAHSLSLQESRRSYPVHLRAVVTFYDALIDPRRPSFFVHDASGGIFVALSVLPDFPVRAGMQVEVLGVSGAGDFAPIVDRGKIKYLGPSSLPAVAPRVALSRLLTGAEDGQWVEIEGVLRSVHESKWDVILNIAMNEGIISAITPKGSNTNYEELLDARIRLRGNAAPIFNRMRQMTGAHILFPGRDMIQVDDAAAANPFASPAQPIAELLRFDPHAVYRRRTHVRGRVTMFWPGRLICIQDAGQGVCAQTTQSSPLKNGLCDIHPDVPEEIAADPVRLGQILLNLLGNALKFTALGEIELSASVDAINGNKAQLHFVVRDTGIGIPLHRQKAIFEPFSQADSSTTRKYGGTGLGLTICVRLVRLMGGRIWLEGLPGKGTYFHFTITVPVISQGAPVRAREPSKLAGLPVLIVDGNAAARRVLATMAVRERMRPQLAASAAEALATLQSQSFGLLLIDCQTPGVDGFVLVEQIKDQTALAAAPVIMLTSPAKPHQAARCRELNLISLNKPVDQAELAQAACDALAQAAKTETAAAAVSTASLAALRQSLRVLLAEDNPVNQKVAARILEKQGHAVKIAGNGRAALDEWEKHEFDLILMDVQMPEMDGLEATVAIRRRELSTGAHIPIIALTAHAMVQDREICLSAGMDGYLTKPIRTEELFRELRRSVPLKSANESPAPPSLDSLPENQSRSLDLPA